MSQAFNEDATPAATNSAADREPAGASAAAAGYDSSFDDVPPAPEPEESSVVEPQFRPGDRWSGERNRGSRASNAAGAHFERMPPHNIEAEQSVLGAMLLNSEVIADVYEQLTDEDFYRPAHQAIYNAMIELYGESTEVDTILLAGRLERKGQLDLIGGPLYLHNLVSKVPTAANAAYYARLVAEKATVRRLVEAGTKIAQIGYAGAEDTEPEQLVDEAQQLIFSVGREKKTVDYAPIGEVLDTALEELDLISQNGGLAKGVPTGLINLDKLTNGLHAGQMIIIAARPGVGKSTLAMDFMRSASIKHGLTSAIFSLEMSKSEIMMRILSAEGKINMAALRSGDLSEADWARLVEVGDRIRDAPLFIDDSPNLTMMEIRAKARQLKQKHDLKLIVVDYLQLMSSGKKVESRQQEVSEFSRQLKLLAKELEVPLIAISQLNRGPESRTDKRPQVADLRESGSLEQDADIVMLIYRPDSQESNQERLGEADVIVAKHRGGPTGTIVVGHQLHYSRFSNLAASPDQPT